MGKAQELDGGQEHEAKDKHFERYCHDDKGKRFHHVDRRSFIGNGFWR